MNLILREINGLGCGARGVNLRVCSGTDGRCV